MRNDPSSPRLKWPSGNAPTAAEVRRATASVVRSLCQIVGEDETSARLGIAQEEVAELQREADATDSSFVEGVLSDLLRGRN
jgi:hypothetical protein